MQRYRKNKLFLSLLQYCLSLLCLGLFLSSPLWLPKLPSSLRHFFLLSAPTTVAYLFSPKCLFVLGNVIVVFLVGESRLSSPASTPADVVYEEYVARSKGPRGNPVGVRKEVDEGNMGMKDGLEEEEEEEEEEEGEEEDFDGAEALPADELNRRVEDFIAKVNRERSLEARMLVCSGRREK